MTWRPLAFESRPISLCQISGCRLSVLWPLDHFGLVRQVEDYKPSNSTQPLDLPAACLRGAPLQNGCDSVTTILDDAREYAKLGFNVVPLAYKQKVPALAELEPYFTRRSTDAELVKWFGNGVQRNLGIVCGAISELIAIDIDGEGAKAIFIDRLRRIPSLHDKITRTLGVMSGKGMHFYLRITRSEFPNGVDATVLFNGQGGEIRVKGNRGYVVAPPSLHPSGVSYTSNGKDLQTMNAAEWKMLLAVFNTSEAAQMSITDLFAEGYKKSAGNNRHEDLLRVCDSLIMRNAEILSQDQVWQMAYVWNQEHCQPPLDDTEFEKIWKQATLFISRKKSEAPRASEAGASTEAKIKKSEAILEKVISNIDEFFTDQFQKPYARIRVNGHLESIAIGSGNFKHWLAHLHYKQQKATLSTEDISACLNILKGKALFEGAQRRLDVRVARFTGAQDTIYYDLCDPEWQCVKLTKQGWTIEQAPIVFARFSNQLPQTKPTRDYDKDVIEKWLGLTNVTNEEHKLLVKVYLVVLFIPEISKAILDTHGEQGSAKTFLQKLIKSIVDPSPAETLAVPKAPGELLQQLSHNYVCVYNNLSKIDDWVSDIFCKAIEGSGNTKRMLYSDDDDVIYNFKRVILLNGINPVAHNADLLDRTILIPLERIPKNKRKKESVLLEEFEQIKPQLLGYIFDILVKVLNRRGEVTLGEYPRLADFAECGELVARCMGFKEGEFLKAYDNNIKLQWQEIIDSSTVGESVVELMKDLQIWGPGKYRVLLDELRAKAIGIGIDVNAKGAFPKQPSNLGQRLNKVKTTLRELGIEIDVKTDTSTNTRLVTIRKGTGKSSGSSSPPSHGTGEQKKPDDGSSGIPEKESSKLKQADDRSSGSSNPPKSRDGRPDDPEDISGISAKEAQN